MNFKRMQRRTSLDAGDKVEEKIKFRHQISKIDDEICYDITEKQPEVFIPLIKEGKIAEHKLDKPNRETFKSYFSIAGSDTNK